MTAGRQTQERDRDNPKPEEREADVRWLRGLRPENILAEHRPPNPHSAQWMHADSGQVTGSRDGHQVLLLFVAVTAGRPAAAGNGPEQAARAAEIHGLLTRVPDKRILRVEAVMCGPERLGHDWFPGQEDDGIAAVQVVIRRDRTRDGSQEVPEE